MDNRVKKGLFRIVVFLLPCSLGLVFLINKRKNRWRCRRVIDLPLRQLRAPTFLLNPFFQLPP